MGWKRKNTLCSFLGVAIATEAAPACAAWRASPGYQAVGAGGAVQRHRVGSSSLTGITGRPLTPRKSFTKTHFFCFSFFFFSSVLQLSVVQPVMPRSQVMLGFWQGSRRPAQEVRAHWARGSVAAGRLVSPASQGGVALKSPSPRPPAGTRPCWQISIIPKGSKQHRNNHGCATLTSELAEFILFSPRKECAVFVFCFWLLMAN